MGDPQTLAWYDRNPVSYAERTLRLDTSDIRGRFEAFLKPGSRILDVGPGSGRDGRAFRDAGHRVRMVEPASTFADTLEADGFAVDRVSADAIRLVGAFDGVWACASLVHLDRRALLAALISIRRSLVDGGILYASFKDGRGTRRADDGRLYTDFDLRDGSEFVGSVDFEMLDAWTTGSVEPANPTRWSNLIARKPPGPTPRPEGRRPT